MMIALFLLTAFVFAQEEELVEREKLAFIERSIMEIYSKGTFPEIFNAELSKLQECGCTHGTQGIYWGANVGMMCKLRQPGYSEECGMRCTTPKGEDILLLCPDGWKSDCFRGCIPPPFDTVQERFDFLQSNVESILENGHDYLLISGEYLESCKCRNGQARLINYGTKMGFDCVVDGDPSEECAGFIECLNDQKERIMIFCPAGHEATCEGCKSTIRDVEAYDSNDIRYEWCINVLTGFIRESQAILNLEPSHEDTLECGCRSPLKKIDYGSRIGHFCHIDSPKHMTKQCDNKLICMNGEGVELIHFCPAGFVPDCERGCGYWWAQKSEL